MESKKCPSCSEAVLEGVHCTACDKTLHHHCAGVTEAGYRRFGKRKSTWRCPKCIQSGLQIPSPGDSSSPGLSPSSSEPPTTSLLLMELRALTSKFSVLESLPQDIKALREEFTNLKDIVQTVKESLANFASKVKGIEDRLSQLENAKKDQNNLILTRLDAMEMDIREKEQRSRSNNVEIKGVKETTNENLFNIVGAIGAKIHYQTPKSAINFITRVPTRDPKSSKPIVVCFNSLHTKEEFIAAARIASKGSPLMPSALGLEGKDRIYVNDHLTAHYKTLLNSVKTLKQEKGFQYVWVKHMKIFARKSDTSPVIQIKSEKDLKKIA